jgi:hypothetical protein
MTFKDSFEKISLVPVHISIKVASQANQPTSKQFLMHKPLSCTSVSELRLLQQVKTEQMISEKSTWSLSVELENLMCKTLMS